MSRKNIRLEWFGRGNIDNVETFANKNISLRYFNRRLRNKLQTIYGGITKGFPEELLCNNPMQFCSPANVICSKGVLFQFWFLWHYVAKEFFVTVAI